MRLSGKDGAAEILDGKGLGDESEAVDKRRRADGSEVVSTQGEASDAGVLRLKPFVETELIADKVAAAANLVVLSFRPADEKAERSRAIAERIFQKLEQTASPRREIYPNGFTGHVNVMHQPMIYFGKRALYVFKRDDCLIFEKGQLLEAVAALELSDEERAFMVAEYFGENATEASLVNILSTQGGALTAVFGLTGTLYKSADSSFSRYMGGGPIESKLEGMFSVGSNRAAE